MCLDCSGIHRSLGTHISFVRSTTMDSWKEAELCKMLVSGNGKARAFFDRHGAPPAEGDIGDYVRAKYNCRAAKLYKEKVETEAAGQIFKEPAAARKPGKPRKPRAGGPSKTSASKGSSWDDDDWDNDDWGRSSSGGSKPKPKGKPSSVGMQDPNGGGKLLSRSTSGGGAFAGAQGNSSAYAGGASSNGSGNGASSSWGSFGSAVAISNPGDTVDSSYGPAASSPANAGGSRHGNSSSAAARSSTGSAGTGAAARAKAHYKSASAAPAPAPAVQKKGSDDWDDWGDDSSWGATTKRAPVRKPIAAARASAVAKPRAVAAAVPGKDDDWDW